MNYVQRKEWLLREVGKEYAVDVLNVAFVDRYVEATGAKCQVKLWGANRCRDCQKTRLPRESG